MFRFQLLPVKDIILMKSINRLRPARRLLDSQCLQLGKSSLMKHGRMPLSILLVFLVLLLNLLSALPSLHELIHADASKTGHQCAVTVFAHGQVDSSVVDVAVSVPTAAIEFSPQILVSIPHPLVATLPPGRGPPAFRFNS